MLNIFKYGTNKVFERKYVSMSQRHAFHLVDPSVMPLVTSISCLTTTVGGVMYFHGYSGGLQIQFFGIFNIILCMFFW
jgi:hypothetical protein